MAINSQEIESPSQDESSLGILNLDSSQDTSDFNTNQSSSDVVLSKRQSNVEYHTSLIRENSAEKLPFDGEYNSPLTLGHLQEDDSNVEPVNLVKKSVSHNSAKQNGFQNDTAASPPPGIQFNQSQDELQYMLQTTRASSGDGGELIDRISMTSSISFLQSQTFPESLFSSYARGSGSGTDSGPSDTNKDDQEDNDKTNSDDNDDDHTLSLVHDTGDGSNGAGISVGRPGLEGANSEPEDGYTLSAASSDDAETGSIELRQSGEGGDVLPDLPGDGGGGGDGSSGHESDDNQPIGSSDNTSNTRSSSRSSVSSCSDQYLPVAAPHNQANPPSILDISEGRGPPVGHASNEGSPPLIPSPQHLSGNFGGNSMDQFDILAASTPMIRSGKNAFQFDSVNQAELSAINSQYLLATQNNAHRQVIRVTENSFGQPQEGSFHLSQVLETSKNREELENTLTDAPSLNFEAQGMTPRPLVQDLSEYNQDKTLTSKISGRTDLKSSQTKSAFTVDVNNSFGLHEGAAENSPIWKSTPRLEEEILRETPGIVFAENERLSPVEDTQDSLQITVNDQQSNKLVRNIQDETLKRLQTPGGSDDQTIPFSTWSQNSHSIGQHYNPFDETGSLQQFIIWNESKDKEFISGGAAQAILSADEKSFEKEHQFDVPITPADVITGQDWTISSQSGSIRRSHVIGINDPNNEGEVRISFGAFIAGASEELGTLHGSDPNRPRPHFGDGTITTPSPKAPLRLIDLTENIFDQNPEDFSMYQATPLKQTNIAHELKTVKKAPRSHSRKGSTESTKQDETLTESRQSFIDEQDKMQRTDTGRERRGSQGSNHSSHSSGSRSSSQSIIKKDKKDQVSRSKEGNSENSKSKKQRKHQQRTHREPDGCSSKENSTQLTRISQASSSANPVKDRSSGRKTHHKELKSAQRAKSEGQEKNGESKTLPIRQKSHSSDSSSLLTSGSESISFKNQQELAEFIAKAVNVSPEHLGNLLHAVAGAKAKLHNSRTQPQPIPDRSGTQNKNETVSTPPRKLETSTQSPEIEKLRHAKPIASSSPHEATPVSACITTLSPIRGFSSPTYLQSETLSTSIDASVFIQNSPENVSVIDTTSLSSMDKDASPLPNPFTNVHIYPTFGKTYTLKDKKTNEEPVTSAQKPVIDEKTLSNDFQPVGLVSICSAGSDLTILESPEKCVVGQHDRSFDSYTKSSHEDNTGRHSWPKTFTDSKYKESEKSQEKVPDVVSLQHAVPSHSEFSRPITIGVPAQNMQNQVFPGISPQFTGTFGFHQGFGPHSTGLLQSSAPLSGTFPIQYQPHSHNVQPTPLGTLLGQVRSNMVQGQYPSNVYPQDGLSAPTYMGPGSLSINNQQVPQSFGFYTSNQPPQPNTVSSGLGPRLATATQGFPWKPPSVQVGEQVHPYGTAPSVGLLQLGQPSHGHRTSSTDSHLPSGPHTRPANSLTPVVIPGEVKLPPVCPVGVATHSILTLHNSSSKWVYCMVKVAYCSINGAQVTNSVNNPFFVPSKLIINPHTTIPVEVIFRPHVSGLHTAQLHITSLPAGSEGQQAHESLPSLVALEAVGEEPDIEVLFEDSQMIDFGEMTANSRHSRPLRLINKGKASIPVRLTITPNAASLHCFSFSNADASPKKGPSSPKNVAKGFLSTQKLSLKGNQIVNGSNDPQVTWVVFQAPQKSEQGNAAVGLPDEFTARVDIEIDSEEGPIIGSVLLKATVGIARLHTPKSLEALTLSGVVGQRISRAFPLRNAGNISLQVDLKILNDLDYFTVSPSRTVLRPQQEEEITIQFKPTKADCVIDSTLVMSVMPDGPVYDLLLRGMATSEKDIPKKESELLLCNKPVVCWGGVSVGNAVQQKVILKHNGSPSSKRLKLQLSVQHPDFQLQNTFGKVDEKSMASVVNLAPQEELPVHILFAPSTLGLISSALLIRNNKTKSKVPLHGCGGSSELVIVDTRKLSEGYIANIGEVYLGKKNVVKVTVKNAGNRAAFVKAICYSDVASQTVYLASHLSIAPNNFVLPERTSKQIVIVYQPLEDDAIKCRNEVTTVATIAFYTGDEGIRQQYKRYVQRNDIPYTAAQCKGPLTNINFLTAFQDEHKLLEDAVYPQVPNWNQFFQSCVSRVLLMLVGSPPSVQDKDRSLDLVPMPGPSENGLQISKDRAPHVSEPPSVTRKIESSITPEEVRKLDSWTVLPEQLVLTAYKTLSEKGTGRMQIINFSERPLSFEFIWPAQYLTITPDSGQVPSRSQVMVVVSPRPTLHSSGIGLPWGGTVYIQCDSTQKAVRVQIREEVVLENSPFQPGTVTLQPLESKEGGATPFTPALPTSHLAPLMVKNKQIQFEETLSGKESVMELIMENTSHSSVMWDLSSVAPAYIKASDNSGDLYRATYTAFSFHKRSGVAPSKAIIRIPVHFQPRDPGRYSQFWDLQFKQEGARHVHKQKVELLGQAIRRSSQTEQKTAFSLQSTKKLSKEIVVEQSRENRQNSASHQDALNSNSDKSTGKSAMKEKGMYLAQSTITFPQTQPIHSTVMKVKICNSSNEQCNVKVVTPKGPFSVTHQDVILKPRHYVRIPIKFTPVEPNTNYKAIALFTTETGITQQLNLHGSSTDKLP